MNLKKEGRDSIYDSSLKITVAREYLTGNLGYGKLAAKYGLRNGDTVRGFVKWYKKHYPNPEAVPAVSEKADTEEVALLRKQLQEANLKVAGFEIMMEIAHKELGVDIAKKYGTKQSSK